MKLEDIGKLCEQATSGPWHQYDVFLGYGPNGNDWQGARIIAGPRRENYWDGPSDQNICANYDYEEGGVCSTPADARFIAAARDLVPKLLAVAEAAKDVLDAFEEALKHGVVKGSPFARLGETLAALEAP